MNYTEDDMRWIELSTCTSYAGLGLMHSLIKLSGVEQALQIIKGYTGNCNDLPPELFSFIPYKKFTDSYVDKNLCYANEILKYKHIDDILTKCEKLSISVVTPNSNYWPSHIDFLDFDKPLVMWCRGNNLSMLKNEKAVSIVGSRKCSPYGKNISIDFGFELANKGFSVVSGGAFGIDSNAHLGAISCNGKTIAVLAGGVDLLYPSSNLCIFESILENGLIISENALGSRPAKWKFLERNRLIAAFSLMTVIIEASKRSGALNTASHCIEYGKTLGVLPANVDSYYSIGSNELLKQGAYPITCVEDICQLVAPDYFQENLFDLDSCSDSALAQKRIIDSLYKTTPKNIQSLIMECELDLRQITKALSFLEAKGKCKQTNKGWLLC